MMQTGIQCAIVAPSTLARARHGAGAPTSHRIQLETDEFEIIERYTNSTCSTPGTALMALAICGETL